MKRPLPLAVLGASIALAWLSPLAVRAADPAVSSTASITGRVQNVATGQFLNNARVTVRGTDLVAFTEETGTYVLAKVPSGLVTLDVFYTGLDPQSATVPVAPGQTVARDFALTSVARYGREEIVKLDSFVVSTSREMEAHALAINEQRFAANVKNVVAADTHGDVTAGNVAELMKFLPGITIVEGGDGNANQVSVRGLATALTNVSLDNAQVAHAANAGNTRAFDFKGVNINSIARVEVTKLPLPSSRADSMSGTVNMVSKSAFERKTAEFSYRTYLSMNSEDFTLRQTPFPYENRTYKAIPGFDLTYTRPVSDGFGFVVNAANNIAYNVQDLDTMTWSGAGTSTGATPAMPYLQSYQFVDAPKYISRQAVSTKFDWRVSRHGVLSFNTLASRFRDDNGNYTWNLNAGTTGTPTPAGGVPLSFTPDTTNGATGRGAVTFTDGHTHITQRLFNENVRYHYDDGIWRVVAGGAFSHSHTYNNAIGVRDRHAHFPVLPTVLREPARVVITGTSQARPTNVQAFNSANQEIDLHDINSYVVNTASTGLLRNITDVVKSADLGVRRALGFLPVPTSLEMGGAYRSQDRDRRGPSYNYTYNGPGGNQSAAPFAARVYSTPSPFAPGRNVPWASPRIAYLEWQKNPSLFTITPAQEVANRTSEITNSEAIEESVTAGYFQGNMRLFQNRLQVLAGVRYEKTEAEGVGALIDPAAVWVRSPNGTFARTADGARIRKPEAGAVGSMDQLRLTQIERGARGARSYDGYYPSAHLTFNATPNLLARFAYAKTYGRPDFSNIIPNASVDEADVNLEANPQAMPGTINLRNTGLRPWTADNFDLSLEYYPDKGGLFSVGAFRKNIADFFGSIARIVTPAEIEQFGLDPRFVGWTLRTSINAGDARISGLEFNFRHSLAFAGAWGRQFEVWANGTKLKLEGQNEADWRGFVPESLNWGMTFSRRPFMVMAQWTFQGESQRAPVATMGAKAFQFGKARTAMDLNIEYLVRGNVSVFTNVRNVFNEYFSMLAYGPETPAYAKFFRDTNNGVQFALGVKGRF
jgi:iron complex outermembrane receptor protein